ncbi:unnamed protein product [Schistosoma rodhaini]|nr:unnamed protein product [Schistosoma rodhaini]
MKSLARTQSSINLLRRRSPIRNQGYSDNNSLVSCETVHEDEHKFGKCLFCGMFHPCNSCVFRNSKCFKCGKTGHIQSVCNTMVHFAETNAKICDHTKLDVSNDHLSLSKTSRSGIMSHSSPELNETQSHCETEVSNQPTYQMFRVIVPDMVCHNNSHISDEISYNSENNMLNESNHGQKPDSVLIDADFFNDPLFSNETLDKFEGNISEKCNSDVSGPHNGFISRDIPKECDKYVPDESNSSHISDVIVLDGGYSPSQCVSIRIPGQWYDESDGIASFPEAIREPVCPNMKFALVENPNQVQDYPNEYEADESHALITHINAYLSVCSNMNNKKNMHHNFYASQSHMMECLKLRVCLSPNTHI